MQPLENFTKPQPSPGKSGVFNYRGIPGNPRNLQAVADSLQCTLSWNAPADSRGADQFRIYLDSESNLYQTVSDRNATQVIIPMGSLTTRMAYVSCVSSLGRESAKIPIQLSSVPVSSGTTLDIDGGTSATPAASYVFRFDLGASA